MATFILVHGAGGSMKSWRQVEPLLRAQGHEVFAPSLTGLGERVHVGGPDTNLTTHIGDIVGIIEHLELDGVVLVGHSYGGMVITGVADRVPERISHLVYLDAALPNDGESVVDMAGEDEIAKLPVEDGWLLIFPSQPGVPSRPSRGHPLGTLYEKIRLTVPLEERPFGRTYVKAAGRPQPLLAERKLDEWKTAERVRYDPAWRYLELPTGHGIQREMPEVVTALLLHLAQHE